jgi:hypothetical protein
MEMELIELLEKGNGKHANHEEDEEGPTCWDTTDIKFLEVSKDKLTVKYHGPPSGPPNSYNVGVSLVFFDFCYNLQIFLDSYNSPLEQIVHSAKSV